MSTATRTRLVRRLAGLEARQRNDAAERAALAAVRARPASRGPNPRQKIAQTDLMSWGRRYLSHYLTDPSPKAHGVLLRDLACGTSARRMREVVVGSRGTAKSFVGSLLYPLVCACEGAEPYILIISEVAEQANLLLAAIRAELEDNQDLAADYPDACGVGPTWRDNVLVLRNGVRIEAAGSGKRLRGRRRKQSRPSLVVLDDQEGEDHGYSPDLRAKSSTWFHKTVMKIGDASTNFLVLANAIHREALAMKLLKTASWHGRVWKSIETYPKRMDLWAAWEALYLSPVDKTHKHEADAYFAKNRKAMLDGAVLLWPGRENVLDLMRERAINRTSFEAEKQCNPVNPDMCEWGDSYFESIVRFDRWPKGLVLKSIALDPSKGKDDRKGDYSAIVELGRDRTGQLWVRADLKRRAVDVIVTDAVEAHIQFRPDVAVVESNQFQSLLKEDLAAEAEEQGHIADFLGIENTVKKIVRIRRLTPYLSRRKINFFDDAGTNLLLDQLRDFPVGEHDDGPDALEMAIRAAVDVSHAGQDGSGGNSGVAFDVDG